MLTQERTTITRSQIISDLVKSPHGKLEQYTPVAQAALVHEPEFLAHLIAWNDAKGQIRDSKVALPVITLTKKDYDRELAENSMAALAKLSPRDLLRGYRFLRTLNAGGWHRYRFIVERFIRARESSNGWWERTALQHGKTLKELYCLFHIKPAEKYAWLMERHHGGGGWVPAGSIFEVVKQLKDMKPAEAAGTILERKIPFLIASGALGKKMKEPDVVMALIDRMSPAEVVNNTKMLERLGVKTNPILKAAFEQALARASKSNKNTLKASKAAEQIEDEGLKAKMQALQEKQIKRSVDGDWLVLADRSGSMQNAIDVGRQVAALLARSVSGKVYLVFFNTDVTVMDATGKSLEEIQHLSRNIAAGGGTSIGIGLHYAQMKGWPLDGIAVVSDGGDYTDFSVFYKAYQKAMDKEPTLYFYRLKGGGCGSADLLLRCR